MFLRIGLPSVLALFGVVLFVVSAFAEEVCWHDVLTLTLEGKGWADTEAPFDRLPGSMKEKVNESAWILSKESAGICVRFVTDAATVHVRWSLVSGTLEMPHMPATGCSGVDLYARDDDSAWRFVGNGRPSKQEGNEAALELPGGGRPGRECLLYLPLYNGAKSVEVGVAEGAHLDAAPPRPEGKQKPLVIYGTSITQGGCAARPGMAWTAILGRWMDRPVINLGFSGSGKMEPPIGEVLGELEAAAYIIDCTWNMGDSQEVYTERVSHLVYSIRKVHPDTPIVFMGQSFVQRQTHPTELSQRLEQAVRQMQQEGAKGLVFVPADDFVGDDGEATVDGVHLTDLGMYRQARSLLPVMKEVLAGE